MDFKYTLDHTNKQISSNGQNRENKAFHLIQAFAPEEVSYDEAHTIGKELADQLLEGKYSYTIYYLEHINICVQNKELTLHFYI